MSRTRALILASVAAVLPLVGCQADTATDVVGKQWQVTAIYDDPALPHLQPPEEPPVVIALGHSSYTVLSACGAAAGELSWQGEEVEFGAPAPTQESTCSAPAQVFEQRFREILPGAFSYHLDENGLRLSRGEAGWTAVSP